MITNFFIPELNNHDVQELWFQQDGATCHTVRATIDLLKDTFGERLISRFGLVNWPPRSCDLTPLDYFLWGYVKSLVYADKPHTLDHLEDNIRRVIADIRPQMLEKVIENWTSRLDYIRASRGSPMPEIIFKISFSHRLENVKGPRPEGQICPTFRSNSLASYTPHIDTYQTTTVLVVGSFSVWRICQALDLPATYDPQIIRTDVFRWSNKPVPAIHSTAIFELCKALDLKAKLAPQ
ncbi:putative LOC100569746 [Trichonephila clavipes]|nr:putative LOC100569746 [Trichonephila clavipes]